MKKKITLKVLMLGSCIGVGIVVATIMTFLLWESLHLPNNPLPSPSSGKELNDEIITRTFGYVEKLKRRKDSNWHLFKTPTVEDIQDSKWSKEYKELPRKEATNKKWYFTQMWKAESLGYDFQLQRFYYEQLTQILKKDSEFNKIISPYAFKLDSRLSYSSEDENQNKEHPFKGKSNITNLDLNIINRSVYGLIIKDITFHVKYKVEDIDDDFSEKSYEVLFPFKNEVRIVKEIFLTKDNADEFFFPIELKSGIQDGDEIYNIRLAFFGRQTGLHPDRHKLDPILKDPYASGDPYLNFPWSNSGFMKNIRDHLFENHEAIWYPDERTHEPGKWAFHFFDNPLNFSYLFLGNFYSSQVPGAHNYTSQGIYLVISLNCEHNKNGKFTRDYEEYERFYRN